MEASTLQTTPEEALSLLKNEIGKGLNALRTARLSERRSYRLSSILSNAQIYVEQAALLAKDVDELFNLWTDGAGLDQLVEVVLMVNDALGRLRFFLVKLTSTGPKAFIRSILNERSWTTELEDLSLAVVKRCHSLQLITQVLSLRARIAGPPRESKDVLKVLKILNPDKVDPVASGALDRVAVAVLTSPAQFAEVAPALLGDRTNVAAALGKTEVYDVRSEAGIYNSRNRIMANKRQLEAGEPSLSYLGMKLRDPDGVAAADLFENALLDTGATACAVSLSTATNLRLKIEEINDMTIRTSALDQVLQVYGRARVEMRWSDAVSTDSFGTRIWVYVGFGLSHPLLLSHDFILNHPEVWGLRQLLSTREAFSYDTKAEAMSDPEPRGSGHEINLSIFDRHWRRSRREEEARELRLAEEEKAIKRGKEIRRLRSLERRLGIGLLIFPEASRTAAPSITSTTSLPISTGHSLVPSMSTAASSVQNVGSGSSPAPA